MNKIIYKSIVREYFKNMFECHNFNKKKKKKHLNHFTWLNGHILRV